MSTSSASGRTATVTAEVWIRPPASVTGTRCTRWTPLSNLSLPYALSARHEEDDLLEPADLGRARAQELHLPAVPLGEAAVHAGEVRREERRLVAARPGADLDDGVSRIVGVARQEQHLELAPRVSSSSRSTSASSAARELRELAVARPPERCRRPRPRRSSSAAKAPDRDDRLLEIACARARSCGRGAGCGCSRAWRARR